jgi:hypothetical protein
LATRFSLTAFVGLALGKETHSDFDMDEILFGKAVLLLP